MAEDPDVPLMLRVQAGDAEAFAELLEKYQKPISRMIGRYLRDGAQADDLTQEVFLRVYRARRTWKPQPAFRSWLYRIATNLCLNYIRSRRVTVSPRSTSRSYCARGILCRSGCEYEWLPSSNPASTQACNSATRSGAGSSLPLT